MAKRGKWIQAAVGALAVVVIGGLGYVCLDLRQERDALSETLTKSEGRVKLLKKKYKEEKAAVGRMQRNQLGLEAKARKATMAMQRFEKEYDRIAAEMEVATLRWKAAKAKLEAQRDGLIEKTKSLRAALDASNSRLSDTKSELTASRGDTAALKAQLQEITAEFRRAESTSKRYYAQNLKFSQITTALVARTEKLELGSTVLVPDPVIQFERVEIEKLLQEYLDRIDDAKIIK